MTERARARRPWRWLAAVSLTIAVVWMVAPTYPAAWQVQDEAGEFAILRTFHSWLDPLLIGYGIFTAPVTVLCVAVAAGLSWYRLLARQPGDSRAPATWAAVGAAATLVWPTTWGMWHPMFLGALVPAVVGAQARRWLHGRDALSR